MESTEANLPDHLGTNGIGAPEEEPMVPSLVGAGFWIRAAARIIDLLVHNIVVMVTAFLVGIALGLFSILFSVPIEPLIAKLESTSLLDYGSAMLGYLIYHTICESWHGASLGKTL